jgi:hypothetical protein
MKRILQKTAVLLLAAVSLILSSCSPSGAFYAKNPDAIPYGTANNDVNRTDSFEMVCENDAAALQFNSNTAEIRILNKITGHVYSSARNTDGYTNTLVSLRISDEKGSTSYLNSYADCIRRGQYTYSKRADGLRVSMTLGEANEVLYVPVAIREYRFNEIAEKLSKASLARLKQRYYKPDVTNLSDEQKEKLYSTYPLLKTRRDIFVLRATDIPPNIQREIDGILREGGYSESDFREDSGIMGSTSGKVSPTYNITMDFILKGSKLRVEIDTGAINVFGTYHLEQLTLLPDFGGQPFREDGYLLLPDGSGAIMYLNNTKKGAQPFSRRVYGEDLAANLQSDPFGQNQVYVPVFGIKAGSDALFAVIVEGAGAARINAENVVQSGLNRVYASFIITDYTRVKALTSATDSKEYYTIYQDKPFGGKIALDYYLLSNEQADITGMARLYRELVFGRRQQGENGCQPFLLNVLCTSTVSESFLGFGYAKRLNLTTFGQSLQMAEILKDRLNITPALRIMGWYTGGDRPTVSKQIRALPSLGGDGGLREFLERAAKNKYEVYLDVALNSSSKRLKKQDMVTQINDEPAILYPYSKNRGTPDTKGRAFNLLSPEASARFGSGYLDQLSAFPSAKLSFPGLAWQLFSNFDKGYTSRDEAAAIYQSLLSDASGRFKLISDGANVYALPYVCAITKMPSLTRCADLMDEAVPFYQMVASGHVQFYLEPLNLTEMSLRDIASGYLCGAGLSATAAFETPVDLSRNKTDMLYAVNFKDILPRIAETKERYFQGVPDVFGREIKRFDILSPGVYRTTFVTGDIFTVNTTGKDFSDSGIQMPALSMKWTRELEG